jgi:hypothetical protein
MRSIPPKVLKTFERMKEKEPSHIELKIIKNNHYVYRATSEWDKELRKVRKITEYIGSIDHDGIFTKKRVRSLIQESGREVFEYGNGALAHHMIKISKIFWLKIRLTATNSLPLLSSRRLIRSRYGCLLPGGRSCISPN